MPDNITAKANTGLGTEILAADDVGGVFFARSKIALGADGAFDGDVSSANPLPTLPASSTSSFINSVATTNGTVIKASAGTLYTATACNYNISPRYLKLYNSAAVTVGTTVPVMTIAIPPGGVASVPFSPIGQAFPTGLCIAITAGFADADATAIGAGEVKIALSYR